MDIKSFLIGELEASQEAYTSTKLEADKLTGLQAMSNIITLLTQIEQLAHLELQNDTMKAQFVVKDTEDE